MLSAIQSLKKSLNLELEMLGKEEYEKIYISYIVPIFKFALLKRIREHKKWLATFTMSTEGDHHRQ